MIAANPKNRKNLLGAAITTSSSGSGMGSKAYASFDGGHTWHDSVFPEQVASGGGDPQVAFSPHGTAYFAALANVNEEGRTRALLHFYRSEDGGRAWSKGLNLGGSYDHPQIAVDHTYGRFAGRIYISVAYGREYSLGVFRSDDDGRTFTGPVKVRDGQGIGANVTTLMVLSDGTLAMTYVDFQIDPVKRKTIRDSNRWLVTSKDGGITFSDPSKIATDRVPVDIPFGLGTFTPYAVDSRSLQYRDRLYCAWTDFSSGRARVLFNYSPDGGKTWREPRAINAAMPAGTQFQPILAVNDQGVVGVMWFDTRDLKPDDSEYHVWFTASVDGGETLLQPVRLSSAPSSRWSAGNLEFTPRPWTTTANTQAGTQRISFRSAAQRFSQGGDYMGLTADADGVFHPFWADSRTGVFQAWTSQVRIELPPKPQALAAAGSIASGSGSTVALQEKLEVSLTDKLQFLMDPTTYDPVTKELLMPIRLKNLSDQSIYKPIIVEVKAFGSGTGEFLKDKSPIILNASNGKQQEGARFDYSSALRDLEALEPNGQTEAVVWRFKLSDPLQTPDMHIKVTGHRFAKDRPGGRLDQ
jgi:hypothetical protein